jgi:signal transduction histidine kinase
MKLFTRYNRINITATIFTFVLGSIAFYFVLYYVLLRQLDETLRAEQQEIEGYVRTRHQLPDIQNTKHQWITVEKTAVVITEAKIKSAPVYKPEKRETEYIRQLFFPITVSGQNYRVTVNKSEAETEDLLQLIILITVGMIALILLFNYVINRKLINRLWQPFYVTVTSIKEYHVSNRHPLELPREKIDELDLLNDSLNKMTGDIYRDFTALKSFTENASHEMQTPLAVIRSKVEILLQRPEWKEHDLQQLLSIEEATQKLSKLHQSLLLLTKLEHHRFVLNETIDLRDIVERKIAEMQELLLSKRLTIEVDCRQLQLSFHQHLAEILVNNLFNNAIRYTPPGGNIFIELKAGIMVIKNTAVNGVLDSNKIFQRFYKADPSPEGTGLGLAIVKEICTIGGFTISYRFTDNQHVFIIQFHK